MFDFKRLFDELLLDELSLVKKNYSAFILNALRTSYNKQ